MLTCTSPCSSTCLDMYRLSCVSVWVRELTCSAKRREGTATVCHQAAGACSLWVACCRELCRVYFLCAGMPLVVRAHTLVCRAWVRQVGTPSLLAAASAACSRGWGCLCWLRARARQAQHAPVRAPRASSPALGAALAATVCSPGPPPAPSWGFCPLGRSPRGRKTSSRRMPGPVSTATAAGRAGTGRGRKMVLGPTALPAGGSEL